MTKIFRKLASNKNPSSLSSRMRKKRFKIFHDCLNSIGYKQPGIIDVGGTSSYWAIIDKQFSMHFKLVICNITKAELKGKKYPSIVGNAQSLSFIKERTFDIAYSNSVIEHFPSFEEQVEMVNNIKRIAKYFFIQTPAFIFPFEPHFLFPIFHWLPRRFRIGLVLQFNLGWFQKCANKIEASHLIDSIRILRKSELKILFKDAKIIKERFFFIPKSYLITNMI
jgi:hypothetical protein